MNKNNAWTDSISDAVNGARRNLVRAHGRSFEDGGQAHGVHVTSKGNVICYDVSCPICQKDATKVTTTTVYHKPNTHDEKIKDIERQKEMEDFKYGVAKNCRNIEKKVDQALDINGDELMRINNRIDLLANKVGKAGQGDTEAMKDYVEIKFMDVDKRNGKAFDTLEQQNAHLQKKIDNLQKVVEKLLDDKGGAITTEIEEEINNLYTKKREHAARLDQAMERISDLEKDLYENQEVLGRNRLSERDIGSLRVELNGKVEDLKLRQDQDLAQSNSRLQKRMDDLQGAIEGLDQAMDEIEQRRQNGENNILKKSMQILKEGNLEGELLDMRRKIKDLETEVFKPKEPVAFNIEKEEIVKEIVQGMAQFERDISDMKKQLEEQDRDIQDAAKLLHVLDQEKIKDKELIGNLRIQLAELDRSYEAMKREKAQINQNIEDLRLACESEFNHVKKSEITDFKNLNNKMNDLTNLQDIVEQLADQVEYMQKEIEGVRKEHSHTPVRIKNKVNTGNLTSSMTPSTMLFSDLKNRKVLEPEELESRAHASRNLSFENSRFRDSPVTEKVRESLFSRSRLSRYLAENPSLKDREYIEIENERFHRERELPGKLVRKLHTADVPEKISNVRQNSFLPEPYKINQAEPEPRKNRKSSIDRTPKRRNDSISSKYSYNQKKNVKEQNEKFNKGDTSVLKQHANKGPQGGKPGEAVSRVENLLDKLPSESYDDYEDSESEDFPKGTFQSQAKSAAANQFQRMNQNVTGKK
ncbi:unnamed protein product [Moneuplotes crassus]|uniref:Uncharacterized protein n=1 Tax=Euplotes crassus TaxID=5936 RepID=A0AAD1Y9F0_EUPCR|nr:unnamed protein product [Moneuplotes crassus]